MERWLVAGNALEEARDQLIGNREFREAWGAYRLALGAFNAIIEVRKATLASTAEEPARCAPERAPGPKGEVVFRHAYDNLSSRKLGGKSPPAEVASTHSGNCGSGTGACLPSNRHHRLR